VIVPCCRFIAAFHCHDGAIGLPHVITRTSNPRLVYDEVDWGLLCFCRLFLIVGARKTPVDPLPFEIADRFNLQTWAFYRCDRCVELSVTYGSDAAQVVVPAFRVRALAGWSCNGQQLAGT